MTPDAAALVVFARAPRMGSVKTRLARALGEPMALEIYRELAEHTLRVARESGLPVHVCHAPADADEEMRAWLGDGVSYHPQCAGDLGARMAHAIGARFAAGARRVVIVGTDCPALDAPVLRSAAVALDHADLVIGPATDGGYYLMGLRAMDRSLFEDIPWSSERTLEATLERARRAGLSLVRLDARADVDTVEDWQAWRSGRRP